MFLFVSLPPAPPAAGQNRENALGICHGRVRCVGDWALYTLRHMTCTTSGVSSVDRGWSVAARSHKQPHLFGEVSGKGIYCAEAVFPIGRRNVEGSIFDLEDFGATAQKAHRLLGLGIVQHSVISGHEDVAFGERSECDNGTS